MFVIVIKSKTTSETLGVYTTISRQPCRFTDYAIAERTAHELNNSVYDPSWKEEGLEWVVKKDDGVYFFVKEDMNED